MYRERHSTLFPESKGESNAALEDRSQLVIMAPVGPRSEEHLVSSRSIARGYNNLSIAESIPRLGRRAMPSLEHYGPANDPFPSLHQCLVPVSLRPDNSYAWPRCRLEANRGVLLLPFRTELFALFGDHGPKEMGSHKN